MIDVRRIQAVTGGDVSGDTVLYPTPGHSAKDRGMSVTVDPSAPDGFLVNSFNGGDALAEKRRIMNALGIDRMSVGTGERETGQFLYRAIDGSILYRTVRLDRPGGKKRFLAQRPDGRGGWINSLDALARVPYRLPELAMTQPDLPVLFVEGERKADKAAEMGFTATAIAFGCKGWREDYAEHFRGRTVVILPDNDEAGRQFAARVKAAVEGVGGKAVILDLPGLPEAGDIMDWTGTAEDLEDLIAAAVDAENPPPALLPLIDMAGWEGNDPPPRESGWGDWLPFRQTSMIAGDGGVGKSLFVQMLCTASALGLPFMGAETKGLPALYLTTEDDSDELWRRQGAICHAFGVPLGALIGKLSLVSLCGVQGAAFATFDVNGRMSITDCWREVEATADAFGIRLFGFDCATDLMAGNHNDLHQVADYVQLLTGLAIRVNGASLILHHTNKAGDDWLGSVAWSNKVRSRWIMKRASEDGDTDARTLENPKANYSASGGRLAFRWHKGAFVRPEDMPPNVAAEMAVTASNGADNDAFLACLRERNRQRRAVSERHSPSFAPTVFAGMSEARGATKNRLEAAMGRLFRLGRIERAELWKGPDRKPVFGIQEVAGDGFANSAKSLKSFAGDGAGNGAGYVRETVDFPEAGDGAGDAGDTHTISKDIPGAPLGGAPACEERDEAPFGNESLRATDKRPTF